MKLREKLFIMIGILFLLVAIGVYTLPKIFISKDTKELELAFTEDIDRQRIEDFEVRKRIFHERVIEFIKKLNVTLYSLSENDTLKLEESIKGSQENGSLWKAITSFILEDAEIDFIQISSNQKLKAGLIIDSTVYYAVSARLLTDNIGLVLIQKDWTNKIEPTNFKPLIAIRYPFTTQEENSLPVFHKPFSYFPSKNKPSIYNLYPIEDVLSLNGLSIDEKSLVDIILNTSNPSTESKQLFKSLQKIAQEQEKYFIDNEISSPLTMSRWFKSKNIDSKGVEEMTIEIPKLPSNNIIFEKIKDPRALANLSRIFLYHFLFHLEMSPTEKGAPVGVITFFDSLKKEGFYMGGGFISKEIILSSEIFDAETYFDQNKKFPDVPIVDSVAYIESKELGIDFLGNVLKTVGSDNNINFVTLGKSFFSIIIDTFSIQNEWIVVVSKEGKLLYGYEGTGDYVNEALVKYIPINQIMESVYGHFELKGENYYFYNINDEKIMPGRIAIIVPEKKQPIFDFYKDINSKISSFYSNFSMYALQIVLIIFGLALIILGVIAKHITKPLSELSNAANKVASGKYSDIILPSLNENKDEVAQLTMSFKKMVKGLKDKEQIRGLLDKVVSKEIANACLQDQVPTDGLIIKATVLFADIRGFTKMTEHANPQFLLKFLNVYMDAMSKIIDSYGGVIDKYVGDEIMAIFGAPISDKESSKKAILSALKMIEKLNQLNQEFQHQGFPEIKIGIGINTGDMVAGNLGAEDRLNYTVLGANVNLAARLCQKAEPMQIRITEHSLEVSGIKDLLEVDVLESADYKGFSEPIKTYAVLGLKSLDKFEEKI
jgi:class 3 adenylate cyclase